MKELNIESLSSQGIELLQMEIDPLYATLGAQILGRNSPTRTAGIVSFLSVIRGVSEAKTFHQNIPTEHFNDVWEKGMRTIYDELKQDGMRALIEIGSDLRKTLCSEDILRVSDVPNRAAMQIVILSISATLRMPREFDPILVTISALLFKLGLRNFCKGRDTNLNQPK